MLLLTAICWTTHRLPPHASASDGLAYACHGTIQMFINVGVICWWQCRPATHPSQCQAYNAHGQTCCAAGIVTTIGLPCTASSGIGRGQVGATWRSEPVSDAGCRQARCATVCHPLHHSCVRKLLLYIHDSNTTTVALNNCRLTKLGWHDAVSVPCSWVKLPHSHEHVHAVLACVLGTGGSKHMDRSMEGLTLGCGRHKYRTHSNIPLHAQQQV